MDTLYMIAEDELPGVYKDTFRRVENIINDIELDVSKRNDLSPLRKARLCLEKKFQASRETGIEIDIFDKIHGIMKEKRKVIYCHYNEFYTVWTHHPDKCPHVRKSPEGILSFKPDDNCTREVCCCSLKKFNGCLRKYIPDTCKHIVSYTIGL